MCIFWNENDRMDLMEIKGEKESKTVDLECKFSESEQRDLIIYANMLMPQETLHALKIEWAVNDILIKSIKDKKE